MFTVFRLGQVRQLKRTEFNVPCFRPFFSIRKDSPMMTVVDLSDPPQTPASRNVEPCKVEQALNANTYAMFGHLVCWLQEYDTRLERPAGLVVGKYP